MTRPRPYKVEQEQDEWNQINVCKMCLGNIQVMIFRGSGFCSANCRKRSEGENAIPVKKVMESYG